MPPAPLPHELLLHISSFVFLPDLLHLSLVCKAYYCLMLGRLRKERRLQQQFTSITYRPSNSAHPLPKRGLFAYLALFLENHGAAHYVKRLEIEDIGFAQDVAVLTDAEEKIATKAISYSKWLPRPRAEMLEMMCIGDNDSALALMLNLLPNLAEIVLPVHYYWGGADLDLTLDVVAAISQSPLQPSPTLPLHNLRHIEGSLSSSFEGTGFKELAPFLALPNVRTVNAACVAEDDFAWPACLPRSRVEKINLRISTVTVFAIEGLAAGIVGPCHVHHEWGWRRHEGLPLYRNDWTDLRIPFRNAPKEEWVMENNIGRECAHAPAGTADEGGSGQAQRPEPGAKTED